MSISEKIKTINNKIEQNKAQYDLDRQAGKNATLSLRNVSKCEFLTGTDVLSEKRLVRKSCYNKKIRIFTLRQRIKSTD